MSFTISIDNGELEKLSKNLASQGLMSALVPDINLAFTKFHNTLESRIASAYKIEGSLDSVRQLSSSSGTTSMEYNLVYKHKAVPLHEYPHSTKELAVKNSIPFRLSGGFIKYTPVNKAQSVTVTIRNSKGGGVSPTSKRTKYKKFLANGKIFVREQKATWLDIPSVHNTNGIRAPIRMLFGPSLADLARITYENDSKIEDAKDTIINDIQKAFERNFK